MLQIRHSILILAVVLLIAGIVRAETTVDWLMDDALSEVYLPLAQADILTPRHIEQAIEQMEFLGHDFFLFANDEDNSVNVVYRRKDGDYGVIQPEIA